MIITSLPWALRNDSEGSSPRRSCFVEIENPLRSALLHALCQEQEGLWIGSRHLQAKWRHILPEVRLLVSYPNICVFNKDDSLLAQLLQPTI